jgi:hypothetical protein
MLLAGVLKPLQACQQHWLGCLQHAQHSAAVEAAAALGRRSVWNENMEQSEVRKADSFYDSTVEKVSIECRAPHTCSTAAGMHSGCVASLCAVAASF